MKRQLTFILLRILESAELYLHPLVGIRLNDLEVA